MHSIAQHYLTHLLREKLVESRSRVVIVSSGAVNMVKESSISIHPPRETLSSTIRDQHTDVVPGNLDHDLKGAAGATSMKVYSQSKFVQLLGAHWWRRELSGTNTVVAVSPGMIPGSGLFRGSGQRMPSNSPDAKSVPQGEILLCLASRQRLPFGS